ncbi:hypothetical protein Tsubulata_023624 [Turnera subulata]|uniref:Peptidase C1A papain C-terminal domain-containing protein n=1 Tax=Turnera subulata TaxID=218843 RepID=A0A9Q0FG35_9ROSI|nr:hypothetical protein Tsubulata_023624 [Turnera subulata]
MKPGKGTRCKFWFKLYKTWLAAVKAMGIWLNIQVRELERKLKEQEQNSETEILNRKILFRFVQAKDGVGCEDLLKYFSPEQIKGIKDTIKSGLIQDIFKHIKENGFVPLTEKEYDEGKRKFIESGGDPKEYAEGKLKFIECGDYKDPRGKRVFDDCFSIYRPDAKWKVSKICWEIFVHGAVLTVFPICDDYLDKDVHEGKRIYEAKEPMKKGPEKLETHTVVLIGWGKKGQTYYFEYLNSEGEGWGQKGIGRVAMDVVLEYHILQIS